MKRFLCVNNYKHGHGTQFIEITSVNLTYSEFVLFGNNKQKWISKCCSFNLPHHIDDEVVFTKRGSASCT